MGNNKEITLKDLKEALKLIKKEPEKIIFEDNYQIIYGNMIGPTMVKLKKRVKRLLIISVILIK